MVRMTQEKVPEGTAWATSFPGFSPTRPTERVGENPGNEVAAWVDFRTPVVQLVIPVQEHR